MENLNIEEQEYFLKHLNYDLKRANYYLEESILCSTDTKCSARNGHKLAIPKHKERIEFLTNLINKV